MYKVSAVVPLFNQREYIDEAIESLLNQTHSAEEILIIDDGSTDDSLQKAKRWESYKCVRVIHQVNKGLASARNAGIMNAHGQYILPLDADDKLHPECISELVRVAKATGADIIAPSMRTFGTSNEVVTLMAAPTLEDFRTGNRIPYCSLIKRSALQEVGGYSPRMTEGYEDLHLWIDLLTRGKKIVTIPQPLFNYRTKETSMWTESKKHHAKLMQQIYTDFPEFLPHA